MLRSENFYDQVFPVLSLMPIGALALICWILHKGELCPGQRSRIQGELITLWTVLLVGLMMGMESSVSGWILVTGALGGGYGLLLSLWQSKLPLKRTIADKAIYAALVPLTLFVVGVLSSYQSITPLLMTAITGPALGHLLIVKARHRLQAFNLLLPVFGVIMAIISLLLMAVLAGMQREQLLDGHIINDMLWYVGIMLVGLLLWLTPLFRRSDNNHTLLGMATLLLFISQTLAIDVMSQLIHWGG